MFVAAITPSEASALPSLSPDITSFSSTQTLLFSCGGEALQGGLILQVLPYIFLPNLMPHSLDSTTGHQTTF